MAGTAAPCPTSPLDEGTGQHGGRWVDLLPVAVNQLILTAGPGSWESVVVTGTGAHEGPGRRSVLIPTTQTVRATDSQAVHGSTCTLGHCPILGGTHYTISELYF